jgi:NADH dehydrogenase
VEVRFGSSIADFDGQEVKLKGLKFRVFSAWLVWLIVHLVRLVGFRNRLVVPINWAWDYLFFERASRIIINM